MVPLNYVRTGQGKIPIIDDDGFAVTMSQSLLLWALFQVPRQGLHRIAVHNFRLDLYGREQAEALGHAIGHQASFFQGLPAHSTLLDLQDDLDNSVLLA